MFFIEFKFSYLLVMLENFTYEYHCLYKYITYYFSVRAHMTAGKMRLFTKSQVDKDGIEIQTIEFELT